MIHKSIKGKQIRHPKNHGKQDNEEQVVQGE
jgi:hypothetical protein